MTIIIQLIEIMKIFNYVISIIAILGGILLILLRKKFGANNKKTIIGFGIIFILYGVFALTLGTYHIYDTIAYFSTL